MNGPVPSFCIMERAGYLWMRCMTQEMDCTIP